MINENSNIGNIINKSDIAHINNSRFKAFNQILFKGITEDIYLEGDGETLNRI